MEKRTIRAGGKINLFLKTERLRGDGFHDIETLFLPFSEPADQLTIDWDAAPGLRVVSTSCDVPDGENNLVFRAAALYAKRAEISPRWSIEIEKNLPVAAGVGGGSSDAAAMLAELEMRYAALGKEKLARLALELGADVPFFLERKTRGASGRGEILRIVADFPFPPLVLVFPGFPVSAKWAYSHLAECRRAPAEKGAVERLAERLAARDYPGAAKLLHNDLEYALFEKFPLLGILRENLTEQGALRVVVSGSGSSLFALMPDAESAAKCARFFDGKDGLRAWRLEGGK